MSEHEVALTVDGTEETATVEARTLLVHALRDLGYTAPKVGCESGKCGTCTVHLEGEAVKACTVLAVQADGRAVTTAAGLADVAGEATDSTGATDPTGTADSNGTADSTGTARSPGTTDPTEGVDDLAPVQRALHEAHGLQCGYCTPGMVMTASDLLTDDPDPSRSAIRRGLKGNLCRCTGYQNAVDALEAVATERAVEDSGGAGRSDAGGADGGGGE